MIIITALVIQLGRLPIRDPLKEETRGSGSTTEIWESSEKDYQNLPDLNLASYIYI